MHLMCSSKKGVSDHQLHRTLEITKSAGFLGRRIREAVRRGDLAPFGAGGGMVEADETFIGAEPGAPNAKAGGNPTMKVLNLVEEPGERAEGRAQDAGVIATWGRVPAAGSHR